MQSNLNRTGSALGKAHLYSGQLPKRYDPQTFPWHSYAGLPNSSQVACINAFGHTADLDEGVSNKVFSQFFGSVFPETRTRNRPRRWKVELEYEEPSLLNEFGTKQPTSIDALCTTSFDVIAVEAKFDRDAQEGFGCCSQPARKACAGHHGPGSDLKTQTTADCRLEVWDGNRSPRLYWVLGRQYFRPTTRVSQKPKKTCPFGGPNYQLMRNFLFAASYATKRRKSNFGVAVVCPEIRSSTLVDQIEAFRNDVLLPEFRDRIQLLTYDHLVEVLRAFSKGGRESLADHLAVQLRQLV